VGGGAGGDVEGVEWARNMRVGPMSDWEERKSFLCPFSLSCFSLSSYYVR